MALEFPGPNIILGAGRFFIDRYEENGGVRGMERYIGDTLGASLSATVERTTIFSGDGAVATKLIDKVTQVDRTLGITPQDATLDNMALFLIASKPSSVAAAAEATVEGVVPISGATERDYFQIGASAGDPAGAQMGYSAGSGYAATFTMGNSGSQTGALAVVGASAANADRVELDLANARFRLTAKGVAQLANNTHLKFSITKLTGGAFNRVKADDQTKQVRVAVRYIEEPDEGVNGRNIYIPQASIAPAGEAQLKSRDVAMQFPLTLGIEQPDGDLAQVYIDGSGI